MTEFRTLGKKSNPMPGNVMMDIPDVNETVYTEYTNERTVVTDPADATVVTSMVESRLGRGIHRPVIDLDMPVKVLPSTNPEHSHLFIDYELTWDEYQKLLEVMVEIGMVEAGYLNASRERGFTAVRMPWVKKPGK